MIAQHSYELSRTSINMLIAAPATIKQAWQFAKRNLATPKPERIDIDPFMKTILLVEVGATLLVGMAVIYKKLNQPPPQNHYAAMAAFFAANPNNPPIPTGPALAPTLRPTAATA